MTAKKQGNPKKLPKNHVLDMDVSENSRFSPQIIHFNRIFHYKPSILGYPYFWKHPYIAVQKKTRHSMRPFKTNLNNLMVRSLESKKSTRKKNIPTDGGSKSGDVQEKLPISKMSQLF